MNKIAEQEISERTDAAVRPVDSGEPLAAPFAEASRLSRHVLNTFHSARKAFGDESIQDRLISRFRRVTQQNAAFDVGSIAVEILDGLIWNVETAAMPELVVRYDGSGPVRVILETGSLRIPEGAHALVADLWYAAPDWTKSYPDAVRHSSVQLPPDSAMAAFEFFPEKTSQPYIVVAGLRWHLDFRHRDNYSRLPGSFNAIASVIR